MLANARQSVFHEDDDQPGDHPRLPNRPPAQAADHGDVDHAPSQPESWLELLSDDQWQALASMPAIGRLYPKGRRPTDDRRVLEAVLWVIYHQARWQDLPNDYPSPRTCQRRLKRWQKDGVWLSIWDRYIDMLSREQFDAWSEELAKVIVMMGAGAKSGRMGRPPFWLTAASRFWRRTWAEQPDHRKQQLEPYRHVLLANADGDAESDNSDAT